MEGGGNVTQQNFVLVIAHRGIHQEPGCAENSICAIDAAYEAGADGIELDVKIAVENPIGLRPTVLGHDNAVGRELVDWAGKTQPWSLFGAGPFPQNDPAYRDLAKLPFLYDINAHNNPNNPKRSDMSAADLKTRHLRDQYDQPTADKQIGVRDALEHVIDNSLNMMVWLDIKNLDGLIASIPEIEEVRASRNNPAVIQKIGLKLGWNVIRDNPNPNNISDFQTTGLRYFFVFGTGDFDSMAQWARSNGYTGSGTANAVMYTYNQFCTTANGCLGAELAHKYPGAPTQAVYDQLMLAGPISAPFGKQIAGFHTVPQYDWYVSTLPEEHKAAAYGRWYPRTDGTCCFAPTDTLNLSEEYSREAGTHQSSESHDLRPSYNWNENTYTFITTDDPRRVLRELYAKGKRSQAIADDLGGGSLYPSGGDPQEFGPLADGVYRFKDGGYLKATATGGNMWVGGNDCYRECMWYLRGRRYGQYSITNIQTGLSLFQSGPSQTTTAPYADQPGFRWSFPLAWSVTPGQPLNWELRADLPTPVKVADAVVESQAGAIPERITTAGPAGYVFCADEGASNEACSTSLFATYAFGTGDRWVFKGPMQGGIACTVDAFGRDPAQGVVKGCFVAPRSPGDSTAYFGGPTCSENSVCAMPSYGSLIRLGANARDGYYKNQPVAPFAPNYYKCQIDTLIGQLGAHDPDPGATKQCRTTTAAGWAAYTSPGAPSELFVCAREGEVCSFDGTGQVAYGADGKFTYKTVTNSILCGTSAFGVDPNYGVVKSCYYRDVSRPQIGDFSSSVDTGTYKNFPNNPQLVAFGAGNQWRFKQLVIDLDCSVPGIGVDPAPGVAKRCYTYRSNWQVCATEGGNCPVPKGSVVAFGVPGGLLGPANQGSSKLVYKMWPDAGTVNCSVSTFGSDPAPQVTKTCFHIVAPLRTTPPPGFTYCGSENNGVDMCRIGAGRVAQVAFGSYGKFIYLSSQVGDFSCTPEFFSKNGAYPPINPNPDFTDGCYYRLY